MHEGILAARLDAARQMGREARAMEAASVDAIGEVRRLRMVSDYMRDLPPSTVRTMAINYRADAQYYRNRAKLAEGRVRRLEGRADG